MNPCPKPIRKKDKKLTVAFRKYWCVVQSSECIPGGDVCFEHWKTKKSGGDDTVENGNPMCVGCHNLKGRMGVKSFWKKFKNKIQANRRAQGLPPFDPGF